MIKINLAKRKGAAAKDKGGGGGGGFKLGGALSGIDREALGALPIRKFVVGIGACFVANYMLTDYQASEMNQVNAQAAQLQQKLSSLKAQESQVKALFAVKDQMDKDEKVIQAKIDTLRALMADRDNPPKMMRALSTAMPENLWLNRFEVNDLQVKITGNALDYADVSDFMKHLSETAYFTDVELDSTVEKKEEGAAVIKEFTVKAVKR